MSIVIFAIGAGADAGAALEAISGEVLEALFPHAANKNNVTSK
jgi:hypothetical protein